MAMNYYLYGFLSGYLRKTATLAGPAIFNAGGAGEADSLVDTNPDKGSAPDGRNTPKPVNPPVETTETPRKVQDFRGMQ